MTERLTTAPVWLRVAALLMLGHASIAFILDPSVVRMIGILVVVGLGLLLLVGSRGGWVIVVLGASAQVVDSLGADRNYLLAAVGGAVLWCSLSSRALWYVWRDERAYPLFRFGGKSATVFRSLRNRSNDLVAAVAGWDTDTGSVASASRSYQQLLWRLGGACVALFIVCILISKLQDVAAESVAVDVVAAISRVVYVVVQLSFLWVVLLACMRWFGPADTSSHSERHKP